MSNIKLFENKKIRSIWNESEEQWYFSIIDIVEILAATDRGRKYWSDLKKKIIKEGYIEVSEKIGQLKMEAPDGKMRLTDAADTKTVLRVIQSIPSPKAEPFKQWLAQVGAERLEEIADPEKAAKRIRETYRAKGYSDEWIEKRVRGIAVRDELTDEWKKRGVQEQKDYAILTAEISQATFGLKPSEHKKFKELSNPQDNLRDHMTDLELIFTMLGEASTTEIAKVTDTQGFEENKTAAKKGGKIAGDARKKLEQETGRRVVSQTNYKHLAQNKKKEISNENKND